MVDIPQNVNVIKKRGSPTHATTIMGDLVEKQDWIIPPIYMYKVVCEDYHDEHFVYVDPAFERGENPWFAWCTCGSAAVLVKVDRGIADPREYNTLVCMEYTRVGYHQTSDGRKWE